MNEKQIDSYVIFYNISPEELDNLINDISEIDQDNLFGDNYELINKFKNLSYTINTKKEFLKNLII